MLAFCNSLVEECYFWKVVVFQRRFSFSLLPPWSKSAFNLIYVDKVSHGTPNLVFSRVKQLLGKDYLFKVCGRCVLKHRCPASCRASLKQVKLHFHKGNTDSTDLVPVKNKWLAPGNLYLTVVDSKVLESKTKGKVNLKETSGVTQIL